jgi:hypothetical protein
MDRKARAARWWSCLVCRGCLVHPFAGREMRCEAACWCMLEHAEASGWEDHRARGKKGRGQRTLNDSWARDETGIAPWKSLQLGTIPIAGVLSM